MSHRVLIMAGGTGGHVFPALTVAKELSMRSVSVEWLGTARGIENRLVPEAQIPLHHIEVQGLRGKGLVKLVLAPFLLLKALAQALRVLRKQRPELVLGFGGFASGPGGLAAFILRIPLLIHEQNAVAGTTNRLLSRLASKVLCAFPAAFEGAVHVGNPVRAEISALANKAREFEPKSSFNLLILGGSLGAKAINEIMPQALANLPESLSIQVRHQTGQAHEDSTQEAYRSLNVEGEVTAFIADMASAYEWADLVICRAGALTVSEITAAGVASILIPYPHAIDDHQTKNGEWLVENGAAKMYTQASLTPENIQTLIEDLMSDPSKLNSMAERARLLALPDAANQVASICMEMING